MAYDGNALQANQDKDLASKNEANKLARDIKPMPSVVDPIRKEACRYDLKIFCETYYPDAVYMGWSKTHLQYLKNLQIVILEGGRIAEAMARGGGKSTLAKIASQWAILYGHRKFIVLAGAAVDSSELLMKSIKEDLLTNGLLLEDFPSACHAFVKLDGEARKQGGQLYEGEKTKIEWGTKSVMFPRIKGSESYGSCIMVASIDKNIRGQAISINGKTIRPDLVLLDDPQTDESAASALQTRKRMKTINGAFAGLGGPGVKISMLMPCTIIQKGDLADQILNNKLWRGNVSGLLESMPGEGCSEDERIAIDKHWDEYRIIQECEEDEDSFDNATEYYKINRHIMDKGAVADWTERFNHDEISAIQNAMNLKIFNEPAFWAEYMNQPMTEDLGERRLSTGEVLEQLNHRVRLTVPLACNVITSHIDVHDDVLYYLVLAVDDNFSGSIIDYGTYPKQSTRNFVKRTAINTLATTYPAMGTEARIRTGVKYLLEKLGGTVYKRDDNTAMHINKILVDCGYKADEVYSAIAASGVTQAIAARGMGIKASGKPMSEYKKEVGTVKGHHWRIPNTKKNHGLRHVQVDTNYWKSFVHNRFFTTQGDKGNMSLWGDKISDHENIANHIAKSENWIKNEAMGREVHEWFVLPTGRQDNHWFDTLVGACCAASIVGVQFGTEMVVVKKRKVKRVKMSDRIKQRQRA